MANNVFGRMKNNNDEITKTSIDKIEGNNDEKNNKGQEISFSSLKKVVSDLVPGKKLVSEGKQTVSIPVLKKESEQLVKLNFELTSVLGIEVYDLYKNEGFHHESILPFLKKMQINKERIFEIEKIIDNIQKENKNKNICECGNKVKANDIFCPKCGMLVNENYIRCSCGNVQLKENEFCNTCGKALKSETDLEPKICLCGNQIEAGELICAECGREIS